jgi:hypothetical protein
MAIGMWHKTVIVEWFDEFDEEVLLKTEKCENKEFEESFSL